MGILAFDRSTIDSRITGRSLDSTNTSLHRHLQSSDEEHSLIARYAARLAQENRTPNTNLSVDDEFSSDNSQLQREIIAQLESRNKEIMKEIVRLRRQQESEQINQENPALMSELRALRQRKGELEGHLGALQDSRLGS